MATRTEIKMPAGLTPEDAEDLPSGQAHWWLRQRDGEFVKMPKRVRGDLDLDITLSLEPGSYVLGVGPVRGGVRSDIEVVETHSGAPTATNAADIQGKRFVFTGDLDCLGRDQLKPFLEGLGAKMTGSVSGKTDYLVVGHDPGAKKLEKAQQVGTSVLDEAGFITLVGIQTAAPTPAGQSTSQQIASRYLARISVDPAARDKAEAVAGTDHFDDIGEAGREIWAIAIGPRGGRYQVFLDLGNRNARWALRCTCSSRKSPCRHALALLITAATQWIPPAPVPAGHREAVQDYFSFME